MRGRLSHKIRQILGQRDIAWLAILALLANTLLPSAISATVGTESTEVAAAFCGGARGPEPAKGNPAGSDLHCLFCAAPLSGLPPIAGSSFVAAPGRGGKQRLSGTVSHASGRLAYPTAQPRAPPPAA